MGLCTLYSHSNLLAPSSQNQQLAQLMQLMAFWLLMPLILLVLKPKENAFRGHFLTSLTMPS
jgi:hypothetical protein